MAKKFKKRLSLFLSLLLLISIAISGSGAIETERSVSFDSPYSPSLSSDSTSSISVAHALPTSASGELRLYPGGMPFGIKFITDGVLIIGLCDVDTKDGAQNPWSAAGLKIKDTIVKINGEVINDAAELTKIVEASEGKTLSVEYTRNGEKHTAKLTPAYSASEGKYKTGLYVRDSGAGIGTVTFVIPETLAFAGLGHGICDGETGALIPMQRGSVVNVTVSGVVRGLVGAPGEIKGYFSSGKTGSLLKNTECGVYGVFATLPPNASKEALPIGKASELKEGTAHIYCTLSNNTTGKYEVQISDIRRGEKGNKCFNVKITDPVLLAETGGIVQGMSGSPIIQNGKLVGAVTHVLINDPTTGYGIFIENMLNQMGDLAS